MRTTILLITLFAALISLQGCAGASRGPDSDPALPSNSGNMIASPAAALSAGSGAMHSGMSGVGH